MITNAREEEEWMNPWISCHWQDSQDFQFNKGFFKLFQGAELESFNYTLDLNKLRLVNMIRNLVYRLFSNLEKNIAIRVLSLE